MNAIYQMKTWQKYCSKFHTEIPKSGLDLDGFIREIGMRQKSFDLSAKFV